MNSGTAPKRWAGVQWTESGQILEMLDWGRAEIASVPISITDCFDRFVAENRHHEAISYLALALPRFEAVAWGCEFLDELSRVDQLETTEQQVLDSVQRWIGEPVEEFRRAAYATSEQARHDSPERMIALAAYFSGGSISAPDLDPVQPPPHATARFAAVAILGGAFRNGPDPQRFERALKMGEDRAQ